MSNSRGVLYVVAAPSGAGKTSLVRRLLDTMENIVVSVSYTTRPMRPGDVDGVDYCFTTPEAFEEKVQQQQFLEHAEVFGHHYGTSKDWVINTLDQGKDILLEIDWQGARQISQLFPEAVSIYVLPPSILELERRLRGRQQDQDEVIVDRMNQAKSEMRHFHEFDYTVVNDDFEQALSALQSIVVANRHKTARQLHIQQKLLAELT